MLPGILENIRKSSSLRWLRRLTFTYTSFSGLVTWRSSRWLTEHSQRLWLLGLEGRLAHNRLQSASISHYCNRMQVFVQCHNMPRVSAEACMDCLTRCKCVGFKSTCNTYLFGFTYLSFYGVRFQQALSHINQGTKKLRIRNISSADLLIGASAWRVMALDGAEP